MVRVKHRYLLVNILYPELEKAQEKSKVPDVVAFNQPTTDALNSQALLRGLKESAVNLFGDYGAGAIAGSLSVKYLSTATSTFIIRVGRSHYQIAWAALSMMHTVPVRDGKNCVFRVVRVSGTMKLAEKEIIRRAREMILKARREVEEHGSSTLDGIFGSTQADAMKEKDTLMVDRSDSEDDEDDEED